MCVDSPTPRAGERIWSRPPMCPADADPPPSGPEHALARLSGELGGRHLPAGLSHLGEAQLGHLTMAVAAARERQSLAIAQAAERGLQFVPRLLRGPLRKALR